MQAHVIIKQQTNDLTQNPTHCCLSDIWNYWKKIKQKYEFIMVGKQVETIIIRRRPVEVLYWIHQSITFLLQPLISKRCLSKASQAERERETVLYSAEQGILILAAFCIICGPIQVTEIIADTQTPGLVVMRESCAVYNVLPVRPKSVSGLLLPERKGKKMPETARFFDTARVYKSKEVENDRFWSLKVQNGRTKQLHCVKKRFQFTTTPFPQHFLRDCHARRIEGYTGRWNHAAASASFGDEHVSLERSELPTTLYKERIEESKAFEKCLCHFLMEETVAHTEQKTFKQFGRELIAKKRLEGWNGAGCFVE